MSSTRVRSTVVLFTLAVLAVCVQAKQPFGGPCSQSNTHLDAGTWALITDCEPSTYCADNGTCAHKGCRKDEYPFGYNDVSFADLPPMCPEGQFCPDEGDQCLGQVPIGGQCQFARDDQCQPPANFKELGGFLNVDGTVCLNYTCYVSDVTVGQSCVVDNTPFTSYTNDGSSYAFVVSRDNCANGLYCDSAQTQCFKAKKVGDACTGNKECLSYNCSPSTNQCLKATDAPNHPATWVYVIVALGILIAILGTLVTLWFFHRKTREENRIKLEQYYTEQIAYRQTIMSMSHAKNSLLSLPPNTPSDVARQSLYHDDVQSYPYPNSLSSLRRDSGKDWDESSDSGLIKTGKGRAF